MPRWKDLKRFCENDNWELYKNTDHYYFRKIVGTEILRTKISRGSKEIPKTLFKEILKKQLKVDIEYFNKNI